VLISTPTCKIFIMKYKVYSPFNQIIFEQFSSALTAVYISYKIFSF